MQRKRPTNFHKVLKANTIMIQNLTLMQTKYKTIICQLLKLQKTSPKFKRNTNMYRKIKTNKNIKQKIMPFLNKVSLKVKMQINYPINQRANPIKRQIFRKKVFSFQI